MSSEEMLEDALDRWTALAQAGADASPEDLLPDQPQLHNALRSKIATLRRFERSRNPMEAPAEGPPSIPGYEILEEVGRAGMGVVYKAVQIRLKRLVALKVIKAGIHADSVDRLRFRTEAEAAARLQHPHVVQIHEVGEFDRQPFIAMEFVEGGSLAQKLAGTPLPPSEAAHLTEILASTMAVIHQRGVVHRDLKPANVLLTADGTPKICDFGLAKRLDAEVGQTQTGAILGTPSYMAPEQASGKGVAVGPSADVYALGAILYEMLTGRPPFKGATLSETLLQVVSAEPVPPVRLQPKTPRDLEAICLKCLEKEPRRRYVNAEALAEDLGRFQQREPLKWARPVGKVERAWRWCRRNPRVAGLSAVVVGLLAIVAVGATAAALFFRQAADQERQAKEALEINLYSKRIAVAERELTLNQDLGLAEELLNQCPERLRGWEWRYLERLLDGGRAPLHHKSGVWDVQFSSDGKRLASSCVDGTVKIWDARSGQEIRALTNLVFKPAMSAAFSTDDRRIASCGLELGVSGLIGVVKIWDVASGEEVVTFRGHQGLVTSVAYDPKDGGRLASSSFDKTIKIWDTATGQERFTLEGHRSAVIKVRFRSDGAVLASASTDGTVILWDVKNRKILHVIEGHKAQVQDVAFSPDGARLASAGMDGSVRIWDTATAQSVAVLRGHTGAALGVTFSPDGTRLASAGFDKTVRIWDAATFEEKLTLRGHTDTVWSVAFSPDGARLASAGFDRDVRMWDSTPSQADEGEGVFTLPGQPGTSGSEQGHADRVNCVAIGADGKRLASASWDGTVKLWDAQTGDYLQTLRGHTNAVWSVAIRPDGAQVASASWDGTVKVWDATTGQERFTFDKHITPVHCVAYSPDGKRLASGSWDGVVKIWNAQNGEDVVSIPAQLFPVMSVAFSPDGARLASVGGDHNVNVWDAASGELIHTFAKHTAAVHGVAFSPDGKRLASASWDHTVMVWDATGAQKSPLLICDGHTDRVHSVAFSPDGKSLASAGEDKTVRIWDLRDIEENLKRGVSTGKGRELTPGRQHRGVVWSVAFYPDGERIASASWRRGGWVKVWRVEQERR